MPFRFRYVGLYGPGTYDDRFVLQYAENCGGVEVSDDQYNDIKNER